MNKKLKGIREEHTFIYENIPVEKIGTTAKDESIELEFIFNAIALDGTSVVVSK